MRKTTQTRRSRKRTNKNSNPSVTDGVIARKNTHMTLPRAVNLVAPDRIMTRLSYKGQMNLTIAAAGVVVAFRYTPSAAFDIDPLLGSTATVGFSEWSAFYNNYRVPSSKLKIEACNFTTTPLTAIIVPLNSDPGSTPTAASVSEWQNNPYAKVALVCPTGGPSTKLSQQMSTEKIFGSKMVLFDDNFQSLVTSIPNNNWFWAIGLWTGQAVGANTSVLFSIEILIDCEFFSRKRLVS